MTERKIVDGAWMGLFARYQMQLRGPDRLIRGVLRPGLHPDDPEVRRVLDGWPGRWAAEAVGSEEGSGDAPEVVLVLIDEVREAAGPRWWLHLALFLATLFTTLMAGALILGFDPLDARITVLAGVALPIPTTVDWAELWRGASFALPLLAILTAHECGHWFTALHHRVRVTPPYFIPFPAYFSLVGTLGAFIRIRAPLVRRAVLFDVGAAGPWAGMVVALPVLVWGMAHSGASVQPPPDPAYPFLIGFAGQSIWLGGGALMRAAAHIVGDPAQSAILLHPTAFAGWLGLFVTSLNLLPLAQLDGGHVLYARNGRLQQVAGHLFFLALVPLGFLWWGWWLWAGVALFLFRGRMRHPPLLLEEEPLDPIRTKLVWATVALFFLTFTAAPIAM